MQPLRLPRLAGPGMARTPLAHMALGVAALLAGACGVTTVPSLPEPGEAPARVAWPDPDSAVRAAAAAPAAAVDVPGRGCFREHLEEAIALNEARLPVYSAATEGASESISRQLIASERQGLLAARYLDRRARRYQKAGIPIVCSEFVPMAWTPPLGSLPDAPPAEPAPSGPDTDHLVSLVRTAYGGGGFASVVEAIGPVLDLLHDRPMYHCMVRHLLESVARTAALAPLHEEAAARAGLPSTVPLSELLIRLHLAVLGDAGQLDRAAVPLQVRGVPILCRDVPPVPYPRHERPGV
jgi:hypothetical protein